MDRQVVDVNPNENSVSEECEPDIKVDEERLGAATEGRGSGMMIEYSLLPPRRAVSAVNYSHLRWLVLTFASINKQQPDGNQKTLSESKITLREK